MQSDFTGRGSQRERTDTDMTDQPAHDLHVTTCDTDESLAVASDIFDRYRRHYGATDRAADTIDWLTEMVRSNMLTVYTASMTSLAGTPAVGLATSHAVPASLAMGRFWQLRDLYVLPESRRRGVAVALIRAVREDALAAGATRLSLMTESGNAAALGLYRSLGFRPVEGLESLSLQLAQPAGPSSRR